MLHLLRASAGAGKTHRLVYTYLQYILSSPAKVSKVVVLSFTNKATQELKSRILVQLHALARGTTSASPMAGALQEALRCDSLVLKERSQEALDYILNHYDSFGVYTIDAFFQSLLRSCSYELGMTSGYALVLEQKQLIDTCLHMLFQMLPGNAFLEESLVGLAMHKVAEGKAWHVRQTLSEWGEELLKNLDRYQPSSSFTIDGALLETVSLLQSLTDEAAVVEKVVRERAAAILEEVKDGGLTVKDFAWGERGVIGFLRSLCGGGKIPMLSSRIRDACYDPKVWVGKKSPRAEEVLALVEGRLLPLFSSLVAFLDGHSQAYETTQTLSSLRYRLITTQAIRQVLMGYVRKHDTVLIHSVPSLIQEIVSGENLAFFQNKTGYDAHHFLIDEGQDLSTAQWRGVAPLIREGIDGGYESWIVGDAKQAIYRWRGGNPQLLLRQVEEEIGSSYTDVTDLSYNWRSKPVIVRCNNAFFSQAAHVLTAALQEEIRGQKGVDAEALEAAVAHIEKAYGGVAQELPLKGNGGYMQVTFVPTGGRGKAWKREAIMRAIHFAEGLQGRGYAPGEICWLVRNNAEACEVMEALLVYGRGDQAKGGVCYEAITSASLALGENCAIRLLVSALRYIYCSDDLVALAAVVHLYQAYVKVCGAGALSGAGLEEGAAEEVSLCEDDISGASCDYFLTLDDPIKSAAYLPKGFLAELGALRCLSLYALVERVIELFQLSQGTQVPFLNAFKEVVYSFSQRRECSLLDFLQWWERYGVGEARLAPTGQEGMQIMTIHQSKGLGFRAVIIPFCAWELDHSLYYPPTVRGETGKAPFDRLGSVPLTYKAQLRKTYYASTYFEEKWQQCLEQLNLLYVSLTRACDVCYVLAPDVPPHTIKTTAHLLSHCLRSDGVKGAPLQGVWDEDRLTWHAGMLPQHTMVPLMEKMVSSAAGGRGSESRGGQYAYLTQRILPMHEEGVWWHELFSRITTVESIDKVLRHYVRTEQLAAGREAVVREVLERIFQEERLQEWFSGRWRVYAERTIILPCGGIYRPDRVMTCGGRAVVLDYKVGAPLPSHHEQVGAYVKMVANLGYASVEGYLLYVPSGRLVALDQR